jgi:hypothetical protein
MIWNNAWAWVGLATLAVPLFVHLLGRRRPAPLPFPTLRFLSVARLVPARRHRLNDIPLMVVRMAILSLAVAAVAQPAFLTSRGRADRATARAIVLDTGASMNRLTADGRSALTHAREHAQRAEAGATVARIIEATSVRQALSGAVAWLESQPGLDELIVISDFQAGSIAQSDLATVPRHVGLTFDGIDTLSPADPSVSMVAGTTGPIETRVRVTAEGTTAEWRPARDALAPRVVAVLGGPDEGDAIGAAIEAARTDGLPMASAPYPTTIVLPQTTERARLIERTSPIDTPWMFDVVDAVAKDPTLAALAKTTSVNTSAVTGSPTDVALRDGAGRPLVSAAASEAAGGRRLVLFADVDARSVLLAALVGVVSRAAANVPPVSELETTRVPTDQLSAWQRTPSAPPVSPVADRTHSDGRWLWAGALLLLGVETWMRRATRPVALREEVPHARVA